MSDEERSILIKLADSFMGLHQEVRAGFGDVNKQLGDMRLDIGLLQRDMDHMVDGEDARRIVREEIDYRDSMRYRIRNSLPAQKYAGLSKKAKRAIQGVTICVLTAATFIAGKLL